jgi:pimeloyl-ACP methyl ester carboxylesterase
VYRGFRFISFDRAGYGLSDPWTDHSLIGITEDVAAICDALRIDRFGVLGMSAGGPYALATAARLAQRVIAVAVMAGTAPIHATDFDFFAGMSEANVEGVNVALKGREADWAEMEPLVALIKNDPYEWLDTITAGMSEAERADAANPLFREMLASGFHEGVRQGGAGWLDDEMATLGDWGFSLDEVRCPVRIWHGSSDGNVPLSHSEYLARKLPRASLTVVPGAGHGLFACYREALEWLESQSAKA